MWQDRGGSEKKTSSKNKGLRVAKFFLTECYRLVNPDCGSLKRDWPSGGTRRVITMSAKEVKPRKPSLNARIS